jgi:2',3'-cyclic-nucleotide 2'-phosphodiesterase (5'-nucleotidase family)
LPFNNTLVLAEVSGQTLKDMMEMAVRTWPEENGAFPHLSGITFSVNKTIPSSVILNEQKEFMGVSGQYRVYDMKIFNRETEKYEPIDLTKTCTLAASNYYLLECGEGMKMLENAVILQDSGMLDVEALERYIAEDLGGVVGQEYAEASVNITFTEGELSTPEGEKGENENPSDITDGKPGSTSALERTLVIVCITLGAAFVSVAVFFVVRKIHFAKHND